MYVIFLWLRRLMVLKANVSDKTLRELPRASFSLIMQGVFCSLRNFLFFVVTTSWCFDLAQQCIIVS